jgi:DNA (cytosine-5)-methyltransferase 1
VLADLEADGYAGRAVVIPACAVDAPHIRKRVWIVARDRNRNRESVGAFDAEAQGMPNSVGDADSELRGRDSRAISRKKTRGSGARDAYGDLADGLTDAGATMADSNNRRSEVRHAQFQEQGQQGEANNALPCGTHMADADRKGSQGYGRLRERGGKRPIRPSGHSEYCRWEPEPDVGRVAHGVPRRVDRLRCLGNAIVPQIPEIIGRAIMRQEGA